MCIIPAVACTLNLIAQMLMSLNRIVGKVHVGVKSTYPWTVYDDIETRDSAKYADHVDAFLSQAKKEDKPFNLVVGFHDTHRDFTRGGFANDQGPFDPRVKPYKCKPEDVEIPAWLPDVPGLRQELVEYYESINRLDQGVGMILENLKKQGFEDDTLVFFCADNGAPFVNAKTTLYESGTCLPFLVRDPRLAAKGVKNVSNPNMISYLDILPTMLDFCGLPVDMKIQDLAPPRLGQSFLPILDKGQVVPEGQWKHHIFGSHTFHQRENYWPTRIIRTRKYKYHRNIAWRLDFPFSSDLYASLSFEDMRNVDGPVMLGTRSLQNYIFRPAEELYDLEADPLEVTDLHKDPKYKEVLMDLRKKLENWQLSTEDLWIYKDGVSMKTLAHHLADDSMIVPDQFDFDPSNPRNLGPKAPPTFKLQGNPEGVRGGALYAGKNQQLEKSKKA